VVIADDSIARAGEMLATLGNLAADSVSGIQILESAGLDNSSEWRSSFCGHAGELILNGCRGDGLDGGRTTARSSR
jgi:hypothetical protein